MFQNLISIEFSIIEIGFTESGMILEELHYESLFMLYSVVVD